jgi:hypothetical protein
MNRPFPTHARVALAELIRPPEGASRKQRARFRLSVLACGVVTALLASRASADTPVFLGSVEPSTRLAVQRSVEGAATRLARPGCQDVFADFTDAVGQRLSTTLVARGKSPAEAFGVLRFFDDSAAPQCRAGTTVAFTQTGSPFIRLCGLQFRDRLLQNRTTTEIILIHEFLHALGLGENPPTSDAITKQVAVRCGG